MIMKDRPDRVMAAELLDPGGRQRPAGCLGFRSRDPWVRPRLVWWTALAALAVVACQPAGARSATPAEMTAARTWVAAHLEGAAEAGSRVGPADHAAPPFSFTYGGRPSAELLQVWTVRRTRRNLDGRRTEHTLAATDPKTSLVVRCVAIEYSDFPTVEWTLDFQNTGAVDTPILEDVQALDTRLQRDAGGEFVLHHHRGTSVAANDYEPLETVLGPSQEVRLAPRGGRPCGGAFPYFNLEWPRQGVIVAVGWPGQWAARWTRDRGRRLRIRAGQEYTHFILHPGEHVRGPLIAVQFWTADRVRAQNTWRRWMLAHNLPRPGGRLPAPQMTPCSSHQLGEMIHADEANQKQFIDRYVEEKIPIDFWWMDAGWYVNRTGWPNTGTWEVDRTRFPHGLRAITDHAHAHGIRSIVWFEPERVTPGTWLDQHHPEWLLGPHGGSRLLNLGNPAARRWLTDHVDRLITDQGIDLYRQDFNIEPLGFWRGNDAANRQGITEIAYITGYLAYWDELRRRHPSLLIDSCASGGHRNDLETLRRAVPLLRSDHIQDPVGNQGHTYGLAFWFPYYGTGTDQVDLYDLRSTLCPAFTPCWDVRRRDLDYRLLRRLAGEWRRIAPDYLGDYYPLTPYSLDQHIWIAWQFDRPGRGEGVVQAFRRARSVYESARFPLKGLDPAARYTVTNFDAAGATDMTGRELMEHGLLVVLKDRPSAAIVTYKRIPPRR